MGLTGQVLIVLELKDLAQSVSGYSQSVMELSVHGYSQLMKVLSECGCSQSKKESLMLELNEYGY